MITHPIKLGLALPVIWTLALSAVSYELSAVIGGWQTLHAKYLHYMRKLSAHSSALEAENSLISSNASSNRLRLEPRTRILNRNPNHNLNHLSGSFSHGVTG